jgi:4-diphosphocytidyl-2-C-methyl-D-erythritol kinase
MRHRIQARGPAKLNLALSVAAPQADGMHPIASWMVTVDLFDDIELVRLPIGYPSRYAITWHE